MAQKGALTVDGTRVPVSNLDKVLYPDAGFTKAHVIDFYIRVAEHLLPHLHDRPVTLKRYPDGISGAHFYEKDAPSYTLSWVQTFPVPRRSGEADIRYILINDLRTLVWCANLANLEIHPFLHRVPDIGRPSHVVFDLDPGEGADLLTCAEVGLWLKDALDALKLASFAKVSGSKGMQVYVPLNTAVDYAATQSFARGMAQWLEREHKGRVVAEMPKHQRAGKVFIDWSQNSDFKTTVGVYSLRAKKSHPFVSMPVTWDEVASARHLAELTFTPEQALDRLSRIGDLFEPVLSLRQKLAGLDKLNTCTAKPRFSKTPDAGIRLDELPKSEMKFIEPMQAESAIELPEGDQWVYEVKFDGYRALAIRTAGGVQLLSRRNNLLNDRFRSIADALTQAEPGTIFDGEVVALDAEGRPSFNVLQHYKSPKTPLLYYVFDLLAYRGRSLTKLALLDRRRVLELDAMPPLGAPVLLSTSLNARPKQLLEAAREQRLEGIVAKRTTSLYEAGKRSGAWVKTRVRKGQELVAGGYKPGSNGFEYLLIGYYEGGTLNFIAKLKNGFTPATRKEVAARFPNLKTSTCPFDNLPEPKNARRGEAVTAEVMKGLHWLRPELVVQVDFVDWTEANHLRHAKFVALRDDKDPREVVKES